MRNRSTSRDDCPETKVVGVRQGAGRATGLEPGGLPAEGSPQFSGATRPRNRGNLVGACAKQYSRRLYFDSFVEQSLVAQVRSAE